MKRTQDSLEKSGADKDTRETYERVNALIAEAYDLLQEVQDSPNPVGRVQWLPIEQVQANDYNPNAVARQEMQLLYTSISEDGYTQPVVAIWDEEEQKAIIVDGYHRYTTIDRKSEEHTSELQSRGHLVCRL